MARIILTTRYTRQSKMTNVTRKNYINYIGTRENVEKINIDENLPVTERQVIFIEQLIKDFEDTKELLEYEDYIKKPTRKNASELINAVVERIDIEEFDREKYINYIAQRPRVEKIDAHGLFSNDGVVENLSEKSKEIAKHKGVVWSHVLSLRREDAEKLGYNNYKTFKKLVDENLMLIAKAHKIEFKNIKYVCAFHNQTHHPHVHLVVYSSDEKEGYLNEVGIEEMKSKFANSIFKDEMYQNFSEQNFLRDMVRNLSKEEVDKILLNINNDICNEKTLMLIKELHYKMKNHNGSKSYKWFSKSGSEEIKNLIDELAREISKNENLSKLYKDWYEAKESNLKIYKNKMPKRVPIYENETFTILHNHIIKEVLKLDFSEVSDVVILNNSKNEIYIDSFSDLEEQEENWEAYEEMASSFIDDEFYVDNSCNYYYEVTDNESVIVSSFDEEQNYDYGDIENDVCEFDNGIQNETSTGIPSKSKLIIEKELFVRWTKGYKEAKELLYNGEDLEDTQIAYEILLDEAKSGNILGIYDVALLNKNGVVGDENIDVELYFQKALDGFIKLAKKENKLQSYFEYRIGKMYQRGLGTDIDNKLAFVYFLKSANKGNQFAQFSLGNIYFYGNEEIEIDFSEAFKWYKLSAEQENTFAHYKLGEMYGAGVGTESDLGKSQIHYEQAFNGFKKILKQDIDGSIHLKIADMYHKGLGIEKDLMKAEEYYIKALKYDKVTPKYKLGKLYLSSEFSEVVEPETLKDKINIGIKYLNEVIPEECNYSNYSAFALGNTYFYGIVDIVNVDYEKALKYFQYSSERDNPYASFNIGKIYELGLGCDIDLEKSNMYYKKSLDEFLELSETDTTGNINLKIATMYEKGLGTDINLLKAESYYNKALELNNDRALYKLGALYFNKDFKELVPPEELEEKLHLGVKYLEKIITDENDMSKFATYILGKNYAFSNDLGIDMYLAKEYLHKSAELGNEYATQLLEYIDEFERKMCIQGYQSILSRVAGFIIKNREQQDVNYNHLRERETDRKLLSKIAEKKREHGIKI